MVFFPNPAALPRYNQDSISGAFLKDNRSVNYTWSHPEGTVSSQSTFVHIKSSEARQLLPGVGFLLGPQSNPLQLRAGQWVSTWQGLLEAELHFAGKGRNHGIPWRRVLAMAGGSGTSGNN